MECNQSQSLMSAYLDGELSAAERRQLQSHLDSCAACAEAMDELQALQERIAAQATVYTAPEHLKHRIHAALATERLTAVQRSGSGSGLLSWLRSWPWAWLNLGLAGAATAAFAVTLSLYMNQPSSNEVMERELVASHFRALMPDHLADVASTDQHTVKPWFAGKLDFSPPVYDLAAQGYTLVGGRLDYLQQRPVAALAYRHRQHIMNVYVWPDAAHRDTPPHASSRQGFHLLHWSQDGMQFYAVSDMNPLDLADFSRQFRDKVTQSAAQ